VTAVAVQDGQQIMGVDLRSVELDAIVISPLEILAAPSADKGCL
jgi:hypothetical protein